MSDQTGSGSLTALPVIECGRTGFVRMEPVGRRVVDGSSLIQATMKSNLKTQFASRTVRKDIYGVQESQINLFRRGVPKFDEGNSGSCTGPDFWRQGNNRPHRHAAEANFPLGILFSGGTVRQVRAGYLLSRTFFGDRLLGKRIYSSKGSIPSNEGYSGAETTMPERLNISDMKRDAKGRSIEIFSTICDERNLMAAWGKIKGKPGNLTQGGTPETLDAINLAWFENTSQKLRKGEYNYSPARRVNIPKDQGARSAQGTRPLTIASPRDKIIQQAFLQVLEPLWEGVCAWKETDKETWESHQQEYGANYPMAPGRKRQGKIYQIREWKIGPVFLNSNHGFRPERSVHTALKEIKNYWKNINWFIKLDIKKAFDRTDHHILMSQIKEVINDDQVIDELYKMLNANIINFKSDEQGLGVPQGSVLSPFLFNVFMHRLDHFMESLKSKHKAAAEKKENPLYASRRYELRKQLDKDKASMRERLRAFKALRKRLKRAGILLYEKTVESKHIYYIRYADDFIIGIQGDKQFAKNILARILEFIKSNMHFDVSLNTLSHARSDQTDFLGFRVSIGVLGARVKGRTLERFERLKARLNVLRRSEYSSYLRMLREAEKRFWTRSLEDNLKKYNQTMMGKLQILRGCESLSKEKLLKELRRSIDAELETTSDQASNKQGACTFGRAAAPPRATASTSGTCYNKNLDRAKEHLDGHWGQVIKSWLSRAKAAARVVPEEQSELLRAIGEDKLKELIETRKKYFSMLEELDSAQTKGRVVEFIYSKNENKAKKGGSTKLRSALREFERTTTPSSVYLEMPYDKVKTKLLEKGYIKGSFPVSKPILSQQHDLDIIQHYTQLARGLLNFYSCADNKWRLVRVINWYLRYSLLHTLAHKHNKTIKQTISLYSITPAIWRKDHKGKLIRLISFIDPLEVNTMKKGFLTSDRIGPDNLEALFQKTEGSKTQGAKHLQVLRTRSATHDQTIGQPLVV